VDATVANVAAVYYTSANWVSGNSIYDVYGSLIDLTGYTVIYASAVPEPATFAMLGGLAALGIAFIRRRKTAK